MGIEPTTSAWKAEVLPLNYTRIYLISLSTELLNNIKNGGPDRDRTGDLLRDRQAC